MTFNQNFCATGTNPVTLDTLTKLLEALYNTRKLDPQTADELFTVVNDLFPSSPTTIEEVVVGLRLGGRKGMWFTIQANPLETSRYQFDCNFLQNNPQNSKFVSPYLTFVPPHVTPVGCTRNFCPGAKGSIGNYGQ